MSDATGALPHYRMYIDGDWIDTEDRFEIINPASEKSVATAARGTVGHADQAVAAALRAHRRGEWRDTPPEERAAIMSRIVELLSERMDELVELHVAENGVTVRQAMAFHVGYAISHLQYFADLARTYAFETPGPVLGYPTTAAGVVRREPIGVVAGIVPWNFPLLLAVWKLGPALAAGNCIVIKPDEKTPATLLELAKAAEEAGLPRGVLNVVTGAGAEVGARLAAHPDVRKIAFTGSTAVGREVARLAADNVKRVTLELGGKGPNIVLPDADVETAADAALFACCLYQGQACEAGTRLLLPDSLHDEFVAKLIARAQSIRVGDPADFDTDVGPIISARQKIRIAEYIELGQTEGAKLAFQGTVPDGPGHWIAPTIFTGVTNDMRIAREEVFGPVLCVLRYSTVDEAVAIANDTEYGLSAGVWGEDIDTALEVAGRIESGTVWINDWHMVNAQYPFGGYKQSGVGRELGPHALDEYTEEKFVHIDLSRSRDRRVYDLVVPRAEEPS
ncbi:aldehyde dehydrogenase family protein [Streptomyces sp. NPDC050287]|uniref:aldehyde dehydrogenase family protein n=1 Tax=Streptomyces sp. NPDC050287 TaxID=3365608 RepID=UPI0037B46013